MFSPENKQGARVLVMVVLTPSWGILSQYQAITLYSLNTLISFILP